MMVIHYQVIHNQIGVLLLQKIQRKQQQHIPNKYPCYKNNNQEKERCWERECKQQIKTNRTKFGIRR